MFKTKKTRDPLPNVRTTLDREEMLACGFTWAAVISRGKNKGDMIYVSRSYDGAHDKARGTDLTLVDLHEDSF